MKPFLGYAVQGFVDQLDEALETIRGQSFGDAWQNYVYERFEGRTSAPAVRQRTLVLELTGIGGAIAKSRLPSLTPSLASAYAGRGEKTLTRDLNALEHMGLIARERGGYRARSEIMLGFLPGRVGQATEH